MVDNAGVVFSQILFAILAFLNISWVVGFKKLKDFSYYKWIGVSLILLLIIFSGHYLQVMNVGYINSVKFLSAFLIALSSHYCLGKRNLNIFWILSSLVVSVTLLPVAVWLKICLPIYLVFKYFSLSRNEPVFKHIILLFTISAAFIPAVEYLSLNGVANFSGTYFFQVLLIIGLLLIILCQNYRNKVEFGLLDLGVLMLAFIGSERIILATPLLQVGAVAIVAYRFAKLMFTTNLTSSLFIFCISLVFVPMAGTFESLPEISKVIFLLAVFYFASIMPVVQDDAVVNKVLKNASLVLFFGIFPGTAVLSELYSVPFGLRLILFFIFICTLVNYITKKYFFRPSVVDYLEEHVIKNVVVVALIIGVNIYYFSKSVYIPHYFSSGLDIFFYSLYAVIAISIVALFNTPFGLIEASKPFLLYEKIYLRLFLSSSRNSQQPVKSKLFKKTQFRRLEFNLFNFLPYIVEEFEARYVKRNGFWFLITVFIFSYLMVIWR